MRLVRIGAVSIDVCRKCVGVALDPGELRAFQFHARHSSNPALQAVDALTGLDAIAHVLGIFM